jgi:hypothetical protein
MKKIPLIDEKTADRFRSKFVEGMNDECWLWKGRTTKKWKYGLFEIRKVNFLAHRISYHLHRGRIPEGLNVCHQCDIPQCVNPDHLFAGTQADNHADMWAKGRGVVRGMPGEAHPLCRLSKDQILAIRADTRTQKQIAITHGISRSYVSEIKSRKKWKHVTS